MNLSENAIMVLSKRYLTRDVDGKVIETIDEMFRRVANHIAKVDKEYGTEDVSSLAEEFYQMMVSLDFLPNSPTLMNAGKDLGQLSACFVLPVEDTMEGIFDSIKNAALIHKSGGGTGFSFSRLRPKGATVKSTGGVASGPISFMKVFNAATEAVKQGGTRRGANMGILQIDHPDIIDFIMCKKNNEDITNFNISVAITEAFMKAVEENTDYPLIDPSTKQEVGRLNAKEVFDKIVEMAWNNGEPGIVFIDRINEANPTPDVGMIESTNPCGEQPLLPFESCNLGSINLSNLIKTTGDCKEVDYQKLKELVYKSVHFLDNVIDANQYPLKEIEEITKANRKIGLGVMGFADMLIHLGIPYNSEEAVILADKVMSLIQQFSKEKSSELAVVRGAFPNFDKSIFKDDLKLRNATTTTIAPTGTISIIAGASSGIEPLFAVSYFRTVMDNDKLVEVNPLFEERAKEAGIYNEDLLKEIAEKGHIYGIDIIPSDIQKVFVTAHEISPIWHIRIQGAFQKHVDNAVSKTINFSHEATISDVEKAYRLAYKLGCKGITIYRDGSRSGQVLNVGNPKESGDTDADKSGGASTGDNITPRQRPEITSGMTEKVKIGCGNLYVTVNYDEDGICEVFTNLGRAGGCPSQSEATSRLASIALRAGVSVDSIVEQLKGIRCHSTLRKRVNDKEIKVLSCPDAIGRALERVVSKTVNVDEDLNDLVYEIEKEVKAGWKSKQKNTENATVGIQEQTAGEEVNSASATSSICPECGSSIVHASGCTICMECGFSMCG